jgi:hypothetical protein
MCIKNNIITPLGLGNTYIYHVLMPSIPANHVYGFEETGENRHLNDLTPFDGVVGDGTYIHWVEDLYKWLPILSIGIQKITEQLSS